VHVQLLFKHAVDKKLKKNNFSKLIATKTTSIYYKHVRSIMGNIFWQFSSQYMCQKLTDNNY